MGVTATSNLFTGTELQEVNKDIATPEGDKCQSGFLSENVVVPGKWKHTVSCDKKW